MKWKKSEEQAERDRLDAISDAKRRELAALKAKEAELDIAVAKRQKEREEAARLERIATEERAFRAAMEKRLSALRFDNWQPVISEPLVLALPIEWMPLKFAGVAYTSVVFEPLHPPAQRQRGDHWETVGPQVAAPRMIYLISATTKRTLNSKALHVGPSYLKGTNDDNLVVFILGSAGEIVFLLNPVRSEQYPLDFKDEELGRKVSMIAPVMYALREKILDEGGASYEGSI